MDVFKRLRVSWRARYESLGLVGSTVYFSGFVAGLFLVLRLVEIVVVSLRSGARAYFFDDVRYADPHGWSLSNGHEISVLLHTLRILMYLVLMPLWMFLSLFVVTLPSTRRRKQA